MAQDPIRSQKADRWDALVASGVAPAEATKRVEAEFASTQPTTQPPKPSMTLGEEAKGLARSVAQGLTFGFGEELESLPYYLPGGESAEEARARIRGEMQQYREARPVVSGAAELAGGLATGSGLAALGARGVRGAATLARSGLLQGALGGAGAMEGGLKERAVGAATGGALGGALGMATAGAAQAGRRLLKGPQSPVTQMVEEAMTMGRTTPQQVREEAARQMAASPQATVMTALGTPAIRKARAIEAIGGEAGTAMGDALRQQIATRGQRLQEAFTRTTGIGKEDVFETLQDLAEKRREASAPLYEQFKQQPPIASEKLEKFIASRPSLREAVRDAQELAAEEGVQLTMVDLGNGQSIPARTPQFLDYMKRSLDDRIYNGRKPGETSLGPAKMNAYLESRKQFVTELDKLIPGYKAARDAYAGPTQLMNAMDAAEDFASRGTKPGDIREFVNSLTSESEKEFFQRGWLNAQLNKIDAGAMSQKQLKQPLFEQQVKEVFGDKAPEIVNAIRAEVDITDMASAAVTGSRTTPLREDVAREKGGQSVIARGLRQARQAYTDPFGTLARGADILTERRQTPKMEARRLQQVQALQAPASQLGQILQQVEQQRLASEAFKRGSYTAGGVVGGAAGRTAMDLLTGRR